MSRFSLLRLPPFLVALSKTFPSLGNPILLHNHRRSSPPEISSSPHSLPSGSFKNPFPLSFRYLSSSPSSSSSPANVVLLGSEEGFDAAFKKATDEKSPSIFYFTAAWCGPCRLIYPVVEQMSKEFPHVTTYKLDIDQEGITATLRKLQIFSVPTILFFHDGEMASQMVGADAAKLKETVKRLYKKVYRRSVLRAAIAAFTVLSCAVLYRGPSIEEETGRQQRSSFMSEKLSKAVVKAGRRLQCRSMVPAVIGWWSMNSRSHPQPQDTNPWHI